MTVRTFNGTTAVVVCDEGALDNILNGPFTVEIGFRKDAETTDVTQFLISLDAAANSNQRGCVSIDGSNNIQLTINGITRQFTGLPTLTNGVHYKAVIIKGNGTATPKANLYNYNTDTWSGWFNADDTLDNDSTAVIEIRFGNGPGAFPLSGVLWEAALFASVIADATAEGWNDKAQDVLDAGPAGMWRHGMVDPVTDETAGAANQTAITNTTLTGGQDPDPYDMSLAATTVAAGSASRLPPVLLLQVLAARAAASAPAPGGAVVDVSGDLAITAGRTGAIDRSVDVSGDRATTVSLTGAAIRQEDVDGTRATTATATGTAAVAVAVAGSQAVTAARTGAASVDRTVDGIRATTVALSGSAAVDRPVSGDRAVSVAITGTMDIVGRVDIDGIRQVTWGATGTAALTSQASGVRAVAVGLSGDITVVGPVTVAGDRPLGVALVGAMALNAQAAGSRAVVVALVGSIDVAAPFTPAQAPVEGTVSAGSLTEGITGGTPTEGVGVAPAGPQ